MRPARAALFLLLCTALAGCEQADLPLASPLVIRAVGHDFCWQFTYPGRDGLFGTSDDIANQPDLHVPLHHPIRLELTSDDYVYTFRAPELGLLEAAVPDLTFTIEYTPDQPGRYELEVDPMCGYNFAHANDVMGHLVVEPTDAVRAWLAKASP